MLVVGSKTSSNSNRLVETARAKGRAAYLVQSPEEIDPAWLDGRRDGGPQQRRVGAGVPGAGDRRPPPRAGAQHVEERVIVAEDVAFPLPKGLLR